MAEQVAVNHLVAGSNPARAANFLNRLNQAPAIKPIFVQGSSAIPISSAALVLLPFALRSALRKSRFSFSSTDKVFAIASELVNPSHLHQS